MPKLEEIKPGLHRWTADVPDWTPDDGGPEGWAQEVACVAYQGENALVLIDPLVNGGDWNEIDALVERHAQPVAIVTTCPWHARSGGEALRRYGNSAKASSHTHETSVASERITFEITHPVPDANASLPGGLTALATDRPQGEITLWLEAIKTVVAGDVLIGAEDGRTETLRVCPQSWLGDNPVEHVKEALRQLLDHAIEAVVPLHGAPVLTGAYEALERALAHKATLR